MTAREELEKLIEKKRDEIAAFRTKVRESEVYIRALEEALQVLPRGRVNGNAGGVLRQGSKAALARQAILAAGRPMHVDEILRAMKKRSTRSNRVGIGGSVSAYVRKGEIFSRPAPNTFGLIELQGKTWTAQGRVEETNGDSREDEAGVFGTTEADNDVPF